MANLRVDKITSTETFETTGSVQFDGPVDGAGTATNHIVVSSSSDFDFGTGDFTFEVWAYSVGWDGGETNKDQVIYYHNEEIAGFYIRGGQINYYNGSRIIEGPTLEDSRWYHLAAVRKDQVVTLYIDGESVGSASNSDDYGEGGITIGKNSDNNKNQFRGNLSNFRVLNRALYASNFKPPMRELEVIPGTVLLCCQSKTDASLEKTGKTLTVTLAVASELTPGILTPVPKAGGGSAITGSVEFDGTKDYLSVPNTEDLRLADSDFTVEAYINFSNGATSNGVIVALWDNTNNQRSWNFYFDRSANELYFAGSTNGSSGNNHVTASIDIEDNNWYHVAACRSGSTLKLFVNGVELASNTSVGTYFDNTTDLVTIGAQNHDNNTFHWKGFISNLRIVKGTALYTHDFIPPTRELKKVPNTVLLCCQDPDSPFTEATGKTIVGYGDLQNGPGVNFVKNGDFSNGTTSWVADSGANISATGGVATITNGGGDNLYAIKQEDVLVIGKRYRFTGTIVPTFSSGTANFRVRAGGSAVSYSTTALTNGETFNFDTGEVVADGANLEIGSGTSSDMTQFTLTNVYGETLDSTEASNFTPQVGDDRSVTFEGVTKVNSNAYFYLPTGDTVTRESRYGRGLIVGGSNSNAIEYINISTLGNSQDYGDLSAETSYVGALASSTRGVYSRSRTPSSPNGDNTLEYSTLATTSNSIDFGDRKASVYEVGALSNNTRGIIGGGYGSDNSDLMDYVTIASTGDAIDFGNLTQARRGLNGLASPTRGCFAAGYQQPDTTTETDIIDYVTIASTGNAQDFGDLIAAVWGPASLASPTRGIWAGGIDPNATAVINYVTISSTGNAQDFGDLTVAKGRNAGMSNSTRGVIGLEGLDAMDYITIATTGNAKDFGDMMRTISGVRGACSDSHGGLG